MSTSIKQNGLKQLKNQNFQEGISLNKKFQFRPLLHCYAIQEPDLSIFSFCQKGFKEHLSSVENRQALKKLEINISQVCKFFSCQVI